MTEPSGQLLGHEAAEGALDGDGGLLLTQSMLSAQIVEKALRQVATPVGLKGNG